jgi:hypothetical protein
MHVNFMMKSDDARIKVANIVPFGLRMRPELKTQVEAAARANGRSVNSEIIARLEQSLRTEGTEFGGSFGAAAEKAGASGANKAQLEQRLSVLEERVTAIDLDPLFDEILRRLSALEEISTEKLKD